MKRIILLLIILAGITAASWVPPVNVSGESSVDIERAALFVDSNYNYHIAWLNYVGISPDIFYAKSNDSGATWSAPVNISDTSAGSYSPSITADSNGRVFITWDEYLGAHYDILMKKSTDNGLTWSSIINVSNDVSGDDHQSNIITDTSNNLYVFWQYSPGGPPEIYFSKSTDHGVTWSTLANASRTPGTSENPTATVDSSGDIYLIFNDYDLVSNYDVMFTKSTDGGATWSTLVNVSNDSVSSDMGDIAVRGSNVYVSWSKLLESVNSEIFLRKSTDGGNTWSNAVNISNRTENDYAPNIEVDSNGVIYLAWDYEFEEGNHSNITIVSSADNGVTWSAPVRISRDAADLYGEIRNDGLFIDNQDRVYAAFENYYNEQANVNADFTKLFSEPTHSICAVKEADNSNLDYDSTSLKINSSLANITWRGLTAAQIYSLSNKNLTSTVTITSDASSAAITVSEATLNLSANVTITGLTGITSLTITHGGVTVYENGALTAENNNTTDLLNDPTFASGTLSMEVGSFSEWSVEEGASSSNTSNLTISAPELNYLLILILFTITIIIVMKK